MMPAMMIYIDEKQKSRIFSNSISPIRENFSSTLLLWLILYFFFVFYASGHCVKQYCRLIFFYNRCRMFHPGNEKKSASEILLCINKTTGLHFTLEYLLLLLQFHQKRGRIFNAYASSLQVDSFISIEAQPQKTKKNWREVTSDTTIHRTKRTWPIWRYHELHLK